MELSDKWALSDSEKSKYISALTPELVHLRTLAGISQEDLSALIGVSRQTYGAIERRTHRMTWSTYLSLIMFFDYNKKTHQLIRSIGAFPHALIERFNDGEGSAFDLDSLLDNSGKKILEALDDQAFNTIKTMIMLEYARCTKTPGEVIVKSFDGISFSQKVSDNCETAMKALKSIKRSRKSDD